MYNLALYTTLLGWLSNKKRELLQRQIHDIFSGHCPHPTKTHVLTKQKTLSVTNSCLRLTKQQVYGHIPLDRFL